MRILREGLELARKARVVDSQSWLLGNIADTLVEAGDLQGAEVSALESVELARSLGNPRAVGLRMGTVGWLLVMRGRTDEAEAALREALEIEEIDPEPQSRIPLYLLESLIARARGDRELEVAHLREGIAYAGDSEVYQVEMLLLELIRNLVRSNPEEARSALDRLERSAAVRTASVPSALVGRGLMAPDAREGVANFDEAATEFERLGHRIYLARCLLDRARARAEIGKDPRADVKRAVALLRECDARLYLSEAERALAALP
jgi:tetratricopeptide (TPR) repeat protein